MSGDSVQSITFLSLKFTHSTRRCFRDLTLEATMQKLVKSCFCLMALILLGLGTRLKAQEVAKDKRPIYTYIAEWAVPRPMWADMEKVDEKDKPLLDKLVADGTLLGYGAFTNLIHQEGNPTHGSWFTASSEGNLLKALEAIYAQPGSIVTPVQSASKHRDSIMVSRIYGGHAGSQVGGYLSGDQWDVKPGEMHEYTELVKSTLAPVCDKLLADGVLTAYGLETEDYHQGKLGRVTFYMATKDASGVDKASKAFDEAFEKNPALGAAFRSLVERDGHHDFLDRVRFMSVK